MKRLITVIAILLAKIIGYVAAFAVIVVVLKWLNSECRNGNKIALSIFTVLIVSIFAVLLYVAFKTKEDKAGEK